MPFQPSQYSAPSSDSSAAAVGVVLGMSVASGFIFMPMILKAFKPEWSYGRRVAAGLGVTFATGTAYRLIKAARGEA